MTRPLLKAAKLVDGVRRIPADRDLAVDVAAGLGGDAVRCRCRWIVIPPLKLPPLTMMIVPSPEPTKFPLIEPLPVLLKV